MGKGAVPPVWNSQSPNPRPGALTGRSLPACTTQNLGFPDLSAAARSSEPGLPTSSGSPAPTRAPRGRRDSGVRELKGTP